MKLDVINLNGDVLDSMEVDDVFFDIEPKLCIISDVICWQLSARRSGSHKTKGISDIKATTKKPYAQKRTGRARQGSLVSPQFRGGAVIFGPVVRSHAFKLNKKVRRLALRMSIVSMYKASKLIIYKEEALSGDFKTSFIEKKLSKHGPMLLAGNFCDSFKKACNNIRGIDLLPICGVNVYDIIKHDVLAVSSNAFEDLVKKGSYA